MLLLIDVGNTRLKWALAPFAPMPSMGHASGASTTHRAGADGWIASGAVAHADNTEMAGIGTVWAGHPVCAVLVSNVAGDAAAGRVGAALAGLRLPDGTLPPVSWFAAAARVAGVHNGYREPGRLGCDRLAALIGAHAVRPGRDLIVATCGTATTIDALTADGRFIGGMILPGLATMVQSLARGTAQLPSLAEAPAGVYPRKGMGEGEGESEGRKKAAADGDDEGSHVFAPFADHTEAAMRNGCLMAQAGAIARAVAAHGDADCLLSGGAAPWISPVLQLPHAVHDNLVLTGLQVVAAAEPERFSGTVSSFDRTGDASPSEASRSC